MHAQGKLTDEEVAYLAENDIITIGGIIVDFSALGGVMDNLEPQEVPDDFWIVNATSVGNIAYINTKYINFPGNAWSYGDSFNQPGECQKTRLVIPSEVGGEKVDYVYLSNVNNLVYVDFSNTKLEYNSADFFQINKSSLKKWINTISYYSSENYWYDIFWDYCYYESKFKNWVTSIFGQENVDWSLERNSDNSKYTVTIK